MGIITLAILLVFVIAMAYYVFLSLEVVSGWAAAFAHRRQQAAQHKDRIVGAIKQATQEISAIFGMGDD
jgi:hypothetical protein